MMAAELRRCRVGVLGRQGSAAGAVEIGVSEAVFSRTAARFLTVTRPSARLLLVTVDVLKSAGRIWIWEGRMLHRTARCVWLSISLLAVSVAFLAAVRADDGAPPARPCYSGICPHLAFFNDENECGTGALVPWADRLWVITYAPHKPRGSSDKLYEITPQLDRIVRPESVGGTPANRLIHRETQQLLIGPYVIDRQRNVRVIPPAKMFGRLTGTARHLGDPAHKIYYATMEEGFYEVDLRGLQVTELFRDEQLEGGRKANLLGYHGKGLYSGQGRLWYANNGERGPAALGRPETPSGCLVGWDGRADTWQLIRRNQFTEVTGPGGLYGNAQPETDPVWALGWDHRSVLLMLLDGGRWHTFRLPKASHSYDGAHGWNTEWPRIREIGPGDLLMTMHGLFWRFPRSFSAGNTAGIAPRSTYLKVIGDFCRWDTTDGRGFVNGWLVFGCDDTAKAEFLNQRRAKGKIAAPQSQSNLWFVDPDGLETLGPAIGRGAVWLEEDVPPNTPSDPFLFGGFDRRGLHLTHQGPEPVEVTVEVDRQGDGEWQVLRQVQLPPGAYRWIGFDQPGVWVRLTSPSALKSATAVFQYTHRFWHGRTPAPIFAGLARPGDRQVTGGLIRARGENKRTLHFAACQPGPDGPVDVGYYEMNGQMQLRRVEAPSTLAWLKNNAAIPAGVWDVDEGSVVFTDDAGRRFRLPKGDAAFNEEGPLGPQRVDREVVTERDLFNCHGTFYELPAENAGGFAKIRPISTHNRRIMDYCSYRGLTVISGIADAAPAENHHIIRSDDGRTALWVGAVDDLWRLGKPVGRGGPWKDSKVTADTPSDPYLMTGYDRKTLRLSSRKPTTVVVEVDVAGTGLWKPYRTVELAADVVFTHEFPEAFGAYWIRFLASNNTVATAQLDYK